MTVNAGYPFYKGWQANGTSPAAGYLLYTYEAGGTTVPKSTYSDYLLATPNANPTVLNANGEATLFLKSDKEYRFDLKTPGGALVNTFDHISGVGSSGGGGANIKTVDSIAALKALAPVDGDTALVLGYYQKTNGVENNSYGGGGMFYYNTNSTDVDNQGTIIIPTSAPASGRWLRIQYGPIDLRWFGYKGDGSGGDTTALTAYTTYYAARSYTANGNSSQVVPGSLIINNNPLSAAALILSNKSGNGNISNSSNIIFDLGAIATSGMGGYGFGGIAWAATGTNPGSTIPNIQNTTVAAYITASSGGSMYVNASSFLLLNLGSASVPIESIQMNSVGVDVYTTKTSVYRNRFSFELNSLQIKSSIVEATDIQMKGSTSGFLGGITWPDMPYNVNIRGVANGGLQIEAGSGGLFLRNTNTVSSVEVNGDVLLKANGVNAITMYVGGVSQLSITSSLIGLALPTLAQSTLSVTGNFAVNTNKLNVTASNGNLFTAGVLSIGTAGSSTTGIYLNTSGLLTGVNQYGLDLNNFCTSAATTSFSGINTTNYTPASVFTVTNMYNVRINSPSKGAGSIITNNFGLKIEDQTVGTSVNYSLYTGTGIVRFGDNTSIVGTLAATGDLAINSNKFNVAASTGDFSSAGNLALPIGRLNINGATDNVGYGINVLGKSMAVSGGSILSLGVGSPGAANIEYFLLTHDGASAYLQVNKGGTGFYRPLLIQNGGATAITIGTDQKAQFTASTTSRPPINLLPGVAPTSPVDGDIWYDGSNLKIRVGATTKTFTIV